MYKRLLTLEGFEVEVAEDGLAGFEKACSYKPDLILLDVMMPKMNGLQTLKRLKENTESKDLAVYMLTNLANKLDAEQALKDGALKYIIKSDTDTDEIVKIIKEFFQNKTV
jgi:two-component system response regulator CpxR